MGLPPLPPLPLVRERSTHVAEDLALECASLAAVRCADSCWAKSGSMNLHPIHNAYCTWQTAAAAQTQGPSAHGCSRCLSY